MRSRRGCRPGSGRRWSRGRPGRGPTPLHVPIARPAVPRHRPGRVPPRQSSGPSGHSAVMSDRPILLLDVDGVLNAAKWELAEGWQRGNFRGFQLSWDPTVTARLRELHQSGRVEIQWLTTWTTNADRLLAEPMGLPR